MREMGIALRYFNCSLRRDVRDLTDFSPFQKIPQVTFPSKLATIKPNVNAPTTAPLPKRSQPLVETDEPEQIAPDGSFYEDWLPSRADLYPITHESFCLVPSVAIASHTTITPITVGNENGLRILARDKHNIRQATEILESLGVCWVCFDPLLNLVHVPLIFLGRNCRAPTAADYPCSRP